MSRRYFVAKNDDVSHAVAALDRTNYDETYNAIAVCGFESRIYTLTWDFPEHPPLCPKCAKRVGAP